MQKLNLLTRTEVCRALQITKHTLRVYEKAGLLSVVRINTRVFRYKPEDVERFIEERRTSAITTEPAKGA